MKLHFLHVHERAEGYVIGAGVNLYVWLYVYMYVIPQKV